MENFKGSFFSSYCSNNDGRMKNEVYNPFSVRHRRRTTKTQLKILEDVFATNIRPDADMRKRLGEQLGMTPRSVQVWFQNRRAKIKKLTQKKDGQQENTDNTRCQVRGYSSGPNDCEDDYGSYVFPQVSLNGGGFGVYPGDNSIYKYQPGKAACDERNNYGDYEGYGSPYAKRYVGDYYHPQHLYGACFGLQWSVPHHFNDDEYYQCVPADQQQYKDMVHGSEDL